MFFDRNGIKLAIDIKKRYRKIPQNWKQKTIIKNS